MLPVAPALVPDNASDLQVSVILGSLATTKQAKQRLSYYRIGLVVVFLYPDTMSVLDL